MRFAILVAVLLSASSLAARPRAKARPALSGPPAPAAAAPAAAPLAAPVAAPATTPAAPAKPNFDLSESPASLLARVTALYQGLEYDKVIPLAEVLLAREDVKLDQKLEAYRLYGSAKAIVEDPVDAEKPFRMLLRARPDYDLPKDTPPKILSVFRKVQSEERALSSQLEEVERARIVAGLKLLGEPPAQVKGGKALKFSFRLRDPSGSVDSMRLPYRRAGQPQFSSLALARGEEGDWKGTIPGEFTSDEKGFELQYYVETLDAKGPLLTVGTAAAPRVIAVSPGLFTTTRPPPLPRGAFVSGLVVSALLGGTTAGLGVAFNNTQAEYRALVNGTEAVDGASLMALKSRGDSLGSATTALLISTGVAVVATAVMTPFVNWSGAEAP